MARDARMASIICCRASPLRRLLFVVTASALMGTGGPENAILAYIAVRIAMVRTRRFSENDYSGLVGWFRGDRSGGRAPGGAP